ncbi:gamma carbonic anhydrase family protein [Lentisphaera profundi]|uniref:Gamma carbonic anhydrase family protein n=1 Tax=Lentisphaera profundi TaxID=1658616 RepID=A0ABY7VY01_9BACT|nr:gamma carbonic anhydrase family protein [Lentisphaera profundi]WDE99108.1 gamma carbonic anhydrase family protein [Lentisphaera profundi]
MSNIREYQGIIPQLGEGVFVDESAVVIGDVIIGDHASVWPTTVIRGDVNSIRIGAGSNIQDASVLHVTHKNAGNPEGYALVIGDNVTVGHRVTLHGCQIGDYCFIGMGAIIMDGAVLQERVMVGAAALVTQGAQLESGYLYLGSPAKKARPLNEEELQWLEKSADNYIRFKDTYL